MADETLTALARLLRQASRPVHLTDLINELSLFGDFEQFRRLVRELLPREERDIMEASGIGGKIRAFAKAFGRRYFPLSGGLDMEDLDDLEYFMRFIPLDVAGWEYDDFHELPEKRPGIFLSSLFVALEDELGLEDGVRITVLEAARNHVSRQLLERVPARGYPRDFLEDALSRKFRGLLITVQYFFNDTGNAFLDTTPEIYNQDPPEWDREAVAHLTREWRQGQKLDNSMVRFWKWLESDPEAHFRQVVDFLEVQHERYIAGAARPPDGVGHTGQPQLAGGPAADAA